MKLIKTNRLFFVFALFFSFCVWATPTLIRNKATEISSTSSTRLQVKEGFDLVANVFDDGTNALTVSSCTVATEAFGAGWNGDLSVPTKDSLFDILDSGTYTPTKTHVANLDASTAYASQYLRVGSSVTVSGQIDLDPTAGSTITQIRFTLPIASNLANTFDLGGAAALKHSGSSLSAAILADPTNDQALIYFYSNGTANAAWHYSFTYRII